MDKHDIQKLEKAFYHSNFCFVTDYLLYVGCFLLGAFLAFKVMKGYAEGHAEQYAANLEKKKES